MSELVSNGSFEAVSKVCGVGRSDGACGFWNGSVDSIIAHVERSKGDGIVGQLFARRGICGVLFGESGDGGASQGGYLHGRCVTDVLSRTGTVGVCEFSGFKNSFDVSPGDGIGISLQSGGLSDVVGAERQCSDGKSGKQRGTVGCSIDSECSVAGGCAEGVGVVVGEQEFGTKTAEVRGCVVSAVEGRPKGKNYSKNKAKRDAAKVKRSFVKDLKDVCPSLSGSVCTVDTRTANEIEAADTLASCRVVENKVKQRMAELRLQSLNDKDKTNAVRRLEAARMEQRINDAKARSQASFKKCDNSLKSLGSTGSAGEFALKSALTKQESLQQAYDSLVVQVQTAIRVGGDDVRQAILAIPEPKKCGIRDVMNEPDDSWPEDEIEAYYAILNEEASGNYDSDWAGFLSSNKRKF